MMVGDEMTRKKAVSAHAVGGNTTHSSRSGWRDLRGFVCLLNLIICIFILTRHPGAVSSFFACVSIAFALCGILTWLFWPDKGVMRR